MLYRAKRLEPSVRIGAGRWEADTGAVESARRHLAEHAE